MALEKAVLLAEKVGHIFVATADTVGQPHVAAAAQLANAKDGRVAVRAWFCPGTMVNVMQNRRIALVIWDARADEGFQLFGKVEHVQDLSVLNGYAPEAQKKPPLPQIERQLLIRVDKILQFTHAPHSDLEQ